MCSAFVESSSQDALEGPAVTAYTDGVHLVAETREELHAFAAAAGIKRCWFHRDHYDLRTERHRAAAFAAGAVLRPSRWLVQLLRLTGQRRKKRRT